MFTRPFVVCAVVGSLFAGSASASVVSISNFSGEHSLDNVNAVASSEYPLSQFAIASAFDGNDGTNWAADGTDGDFPPNSFPTVTLDLSAATVNGMSGPLVLDTFTWVERTTANTLNGRDQTSSFRLQAFLGGSEVFDTTIDQTYETWSNGVSVTVELGGIIADTIVYTVLARADESVDGNIGANAFRLTGSIVPEPASVALIGIGGLLMLRRRGH